MIECKCELAICPSNNSGKCLSGRIIIACDLRSRLEHNSKVQQKEMETLESKLTDLQAEVDRLNADNFWQMKLMKFKELFEKYNSKPMDDSLRTKLADLQSEVAVYESDYSGMDEIYAPWYKCRACGGKRLTREFSHCPDCGVKLNWYVRLD